MADICTYLYIYKFTHIETTSYNKIKYFFFFNFLQFLFLYFIFYIYIILEEIEERMENSIASWHRFLSYYQTILFS